MKKIFILTFIILFNFSLANAVTLYDALNQTYSNNIQLNAERENIKASEEDVNIAKADYKPSLTLSGTKSIEDTNKLTNQSGGNASVTDVDPFTTSIKLEQTLLDFGRELTLEKNITALDLAKAQLIKKEQEILHKAIDAFTNLILARIKFVNASIALCKISCSFFINCAFAKSKAVIFFSRVNSLPKSNRVCSNLIEVVNGSTSVTLALPPL